MVRLDEKVSYLDMDGLICNFCRGLLKAHNRQDLLEEEAKGIFPTDWNFGGKLGTEYYLWKPVDIIGEEFWENLEPYPWMEEVLTILEDSGIKWYLTTCARNDPASYSGKMKWIHHHLGGFFQDVIMIKDKYLLAHENALLIDDNEDNVHMFRDCGGQAHLFSQPWNYANTCSEARIEDLKIYVTCFKEGTLCYDRN